MYRDFKEEACLRYLVSFHKMGLLNTTRGYNVQEECRKIRGISKVALQVGPSSLTTPGAYLVFRSCMKDERTRLYVVCTGYNLGNKISFFCKQRTGQPSAPHRVIVGRVYKVPASCPSFHFAMAPRVLICGTLVWAQSDAKALLGDIAEVIVGVSS